MSKNRLHAITGAFGYAGRHIVQRLLREGFNVRTLTNTKPRKDPFGGKVEIAPLEFSTPEKLAASLDGVDVLYNTYWVRFNHQSFSFAEAVRNTEMLFGAAQQARVRRIVHVSITNPSEDSPFEYFRGKAILERRLKDLSVSYAILRPAVFFGGHDILINNIAWMLRHFPVFGVFGDGLYDIQPIHVDDFAGLAVEAGMRPDSFVADAVGPERFTYRGLVEALGDAIGCPRPIVGIPPLFGLLAGKVLGLFTGDVMITREEIGGLMSGLLAVESKPAGSTKLTEWAREHRNILGMKYASELARRNTWPSMSTKR